MNLQELEANGLFSERLVHDLNLDPELPKPDEAFDAVICTVSVEYSMEVLDPELQEPAYALVERLRSKLEREAQDLGGAVDQRSSSGTP